LDVLHLIFRPSLTDPQSRNPQRSLATPAVSLNRLNQIWPKSERNSVQLIFARRLRAELVDVPYSSNP
jgi:hypothetical protein